MFVNGNFNADRQSLVLSMLPRVLLEFMSVVIFQPTLVEEEIFSQSEAQSDAQSDARSDVLPKVMFFLRTLLIWQ